MPGTRERILGTLEELPSGLCDDCLSERSGVRPRQQVNQRARELENEGRIVRQRRSCPSCGRHKIVNSTGGMPQALEQDPPLAPLAGKEPWCWEGNVQAHIVTYLASNGYQIRQVSSTRNRTQGKDISARTPEGSRLWVSVKGWPKRSSNTQARHWFSQALLDMVLYRDEDPEAELAVGLPAGFSTYENLYGRIGWFRRVLPLKAFWVHEDGSVSEQEG